MVNVTKPVFKKTEDFSTNFEKKKKSIVREYFRVQPTKWNWILTICNELKGTWWVQKKNQNDDIDVYGLTFECEMKKMRRSRMYFQMKAQR